MDSDKKLPALEPLTNDDFVIKEDYAYAIASLKQIFANAKILLEEPNEEELIDESQLPALKATSVKNENENQFSVSFEYDYGT